MKFSKKEYEHYEEFSERAKFSTPEDEYLWASIQDKRCNKCGKLLSLIEFGNNTSGAYPFNKDGYRLRRGDCKKCNTKIRKGKNEAIKAFKSNGISYKAPIGTKCKLCGSTNNIVFDHDHLTETFRGWLCDPCNRSIGVLTTRIKGDTEVHSIEKVINYLNKKDD